MACDLQTTLQAACDSGIAKLSSPVELLQVIAQTLCSAEAGSDPYDGNLTYIQSGGATTVIVGPVGAYNLSALAPKVTEIHCHNCPLITGITCTSDTLLTVLDLENLPAVQNLVFNNCTGLTSVNLDTFTSLSGSVDFLFCASLSSFSASSLVSVGVNFYLTSCALTSLSLPSLVSVADFSCGSMSTLTTVSLPLLQTASGYVYFDFNSAMTTVSLPSLQSAGVIYIEAMATLATASFPALVSVGSILANTSDALVSIDLSSLDSISSSLGFISCFSITGVSMPSYTDVLPEFLSFTDCLALDLFSAGVMVAIDGCFFEFNNCALLEDSVNNLIQSLTDGGTTSSTLDTSSGTSQPPNATHAAQVVALNIAGNSVTTN